MSLAADMPQCAEIVAEFKKEFGDKIKCVYAREGEHEIITNAWRDEQNKRRDK